jgi:PilZ domain
MSPRTENVPTSTPQADSIEHRRHVRFPLTALVEALEPKSNAQISGRSSDVSLSGCYVDTLSPFPEGTIIRIRLTRENISFEANAKVVFSQIGMGMGVAFTSAEKDQFQIYQRWINQLSGNSSAELDVGEGERQSGDNADSREEQTYILNELIIALMRKGVLTEVEGKGMLKRLHK